MIHQSIPAIRITPVLICASMVVVFTIHCGTNMKIASQVQSRYMLRFEESACKGDCPVFHLSVFKDRSMVFEGGTHTLLDSARDTLEVELFSQLEQLLQDLEPIAEEGMVAIADASVSRISYYEADSLRLVSYQGEASKIFDEIRLMLRNVAKERSWIPSSGQISEDMITKELIVELNKDADYLDLAHKYKNDQLTYLRQLAPSQPYQLYSVTIEKGTEDTFMQQLRNDPLIKKVQWNRKLKKR